MKLTILHLSDIHIRHSSDPVLFRATDIASACYSEVRESDGCFVVVTGDVAFSGQESQYDQAKRLLTDIKGAIQAESCPLVDILVAPGNHDCSLLPENRARTIVVEKVVEERNTSTDENVIQICTEPQSAFFAFQKGITEVRPKHSHKLWLEYERVINGKLVRISVINAAWMSRIPEQPGQLVYPVELFHHFLEEPANLRIALLHHPLNWYAQSSYHPLRKALRTHADAVLSGHEHAPNSAAVSETRSGDSLYFEAGALQPHEANAPSTFSVLFFDLDANYVNENRYALDSKSIALQGEPIRRLLRNVLARHVDAGELTEEFQAQLRDAGGNFTHPEKDKIELDDVFVFPDLIPLGIDHDENVNVPADTVLSMDPRHQRVLFLGDEKAGKSTLLLQAFRRYHVQGLLPVYAKASEFSSVSNGALQKKLERNAQAQYLSPSTWTNAPKEQRVALLDDVDRLSGGAKALHRLLQYLERNFTCILLTANSGFELQELVDKDAADALMRYKAYHIRRFGYRLRYQLIKKWCLCGSTNTVQDLDKRVHHLEGLIDTVVGKNLVPSQPIYLLILLQSCELQQQGDLQNSSFAYYYQYLITKSLKEAGVKAEHLNELFHYLSHLAWFFSSTDCREAGVSELREFTRVFSERFVTVDLEQRLRLLTAAKVLSKRAEYYSFSYPYVYFFFVGKYLADNLHKADIRELVIQYCASLHKRENAHSLLFLTHHRNDLGS